MQHVDGIIYNSHHLANRRISIVAMNSQVYSGFFLFIWVDYFIKLVTVDLCWLSSLPMGHKEFSLLLNLH